MPTLPHPWLDASPPVPALPIPGNVQLWQVARQHILATLTHLLGDLPPRTRPDQVRVLSRQDEGDHWLERMGFDNGAGSQVHGWCFVPKTATAEQPAPAILYCHWHGDDYATGKDEMRRTNATPVPAGPELARRGYVVLGIDAEAFGERQGQGPDGTGSTGQAGEVAAAKFHLWMGRSLWGMMLRDDLTALDYLCQRPEVDASRIGVTGISMGSTRAWWLMALDERLRAAVCVACMTRYQELIRAGGLHQHGIYYFVPGMLRHFDTEAVIACAAPRPMLILTGDQDAGSPVAGVLKLGEIVGQVYALHGEEAGARFDSVLYPGIGHTYLPDMWQKTVAWMDRWVKG